MNFKLRKHFIYVALTQFLSILSHYLSLFMHKKELFRKFFLVQKCQQCLASHITWSVDRAFFPLNRTKWCKVMWKEVPNIARQL